MFKQSCSELDPLKTLLEYVTRHSRVYSKPLAQNDDRGVPYTAGFASSGGKGQSTLVHRLKSMIKTAMDHGKSVSDIEPERQAILILGTMRSLVSMWLLDTREILLETTVGATYDAKCPLGSKSK